MSKDVNVLAFVKGEERYLFLYTEETRAETLRTLGRFASNPELSFSWYDAAVLSQRIRHDAHKAAADDLKSSPRFDTASFDLMVDDEPLA